MNVIRTAPVVAGVDGTATSLAAVRLAAREAVLRHRPLHVVHAFTWPLYDTSAEGRPYDLLRQHAAEVLDRAVAAAEAAEPAAAVSGRLVDGSPTPVLLRESRDAALVVIGDASSRSFLLPVDSVLVQLVARARCPVMVACGRAPTTGSVVVGVDGSSGSRLAVEFAFDEAVRRLAPLVAVHAAEGGGGVPGAEPRVLLDEALAAWRDKYPTVAVQRRPTAGEPATVLVGAARGAQLLVVGARGVGGRRTLLGTTAQTVLRRCPCPAIFVHGAAGG